MVMIPPPRQVHDTYFVLDDPAFYSELKALAEMGPSDIKEVVLALAANLQSTVASTSLPYLMGLTAILDREVHTRKAGDVVRHLRNPTSVVYTDFRHETTKFSASSSYFIDDDSIRADAEAKLIEYLSDEELKELSCELMRQAVSSTWAAFEVFTTDLIRTLFNRDPSLIGVILQSEDTKKHYPVKIDFDLLIKHGFDLSNKLGDVIFAEAQTMSLPIIKNTLLQLKVGTPNLSALLEHEDLWSLWRRRNLVAHRRGVVDAKYLKESGDGQNIGLPLNIVSSDVQRYLNLVRDIGVSLANQPEPKAKARKVAKADRR